MRFKLLLNEKNEVSWLQNQYKDYEEIIHDLKYDNGEIQLSCQSDGKVFHFSALE